MLNRPTVRVRYRFSELEACALKRASLRAPSSFANAETIVENLKKGMFVLPCRSAPGLRLLRRSLTRRSRVARGGHRIGSSGRAPWHAPEGNLSGASVGGRTMRPTRANLVLEGRPEDAPQACSCPRCRAVLRAARGARVALRQRSTALQLHDGSKGCTLWLSARRGRRRPARSAGPRRCRSSWLLWSRGWNSACVARCAQVFFFRRVRFFSGSDKGPGSRSGLGLRRLPAGLRKHAQRCGKGWPAVGCSRRALYAVL